MAEDFGLPEFTDSELVLGIVTPVGTDLDSFDRELVDRLKRFSYAASSVRISDLMKRFLVSGEATSDTENVRIQSAMEAGNAVRKRLGTGTLALAAAAEISRGRGASLLKPRTAHVIRSLKHPDEIRVLRRIYGAGFFLVGVVAERKERAKYLQERKGCTPEEVEALFRRDEHEEDNAAGQRTRDTFYLADVFVNADRPNELQRFLDLIFGHPTTTPTPDENAMFLAFAASLRSADLSRQVGPSLYRRQVIRFRPEPTTFRKREEACTGRATRTVAIMCAEKTPTRARETKS